MIGKSLQRIAGQRAEPGLRRITPHEEDRERSDDRCECPSFEPRRYRAGIGRQREWEYQDEQSRGRCLGDVAAQDSEEQHEAAATRPATTTASQVVREHNVAIVMNAAPTTASEAYATSRRRSGPPKSASSSTEKLPIDANVATFGLPMTLSAKANRPGMTIAARTDRLATASHLSCTVLVHTTPLCASNLRGSNRLPRSQVSQFGASPG